MPATQAISARMAADLAPDAQSRPRTTHTTEPRMMRRSLSKLGSAVESVQVHKLLGFQGGFQDAEGILTTQMLVAAIILSIVVTLHTGTFSHDALVAGDLRHAAFDAARGKELEEDSSQRFVSGRLFVDGYVSVSCSAYSLLSAAAIYISLIFSGAREDSTLFQRWWRFGRVCICLSYLALLVSIVFFLRLNHDSVYLVYPKYNWNTIINVTVGSARHLGAARGSSAAGSSVGQEQGSDGSDLGTMSPVDDRYYGHDVEMMSKNLKIIMNMVLGATAIVLVCGHAWCMRCQKRSLADDADLLPQPPASPSVASSGLAGSSTVQVLAEQTKLLKAQNELLFQFLQRHTSGLVDASGCAKSYHNAARYDIEAQPVVVSAETHIEASSSTICVSSSAKSALMHIAC